VAAKFSIAVLKFSSKLSLGRWRLSLDTLGADLREVDFSGGRIGFGRYVGNKTYVSVSQELANDHGREVALEYEIARDWKIGTTTSSSGSKGIDIIWNKRY
jgi:autotransporter translocation and assembly factor TamB